MAARVSLRLLFDFSLRMTLLMSSDLALFFRLLRLACVRITCLLLLFFTPYFSCSRSLLGCEGGASRVTAYFATRGVSASFRSSSLSSSSSSFPLKSRGDFDQLLLKVSRWLLLSSSLGEDASNENG